eukprot:PhM_4_TR15165/c0_g1_i1/m.15467
MTQWAVWSIICTLEKHRSTSAGRDVGFIDDTIDELQCQWGARPEDRLSNKLIVSRLWERWTGKLQARQKEYHASKKIMKATLKRSSEEMQQMKEQMVKLEFEKDMQNARHETDILKERIKVLESARNVTVTNNIQS